MKKTQNIATKKTVSIKHGKHYALSLLMVAIAVLAFFACGIPLQKDMALAYTLPLQGIKLNELAQAAEANMGDTPLLWQYNFSGTSWNNAPCSPVIDGDKVIVFSGDEVFKFQLESGKILQTEKTNLTLGFGVIAPTIFSQNGKKYICMAFSRGNIACFDFESMQTVWRYTDDCKGQCNSPILFSDGMLYTGFWTGETTDANFIALNAQTGEKVWSYAHFESMQTVWRYTDDCKGQCNSPILFSDGMLYTGFWTGETTDANFIALNAQTGEKVWSYAHKGGFYWSGGVVVGNVLIIGGDDGVGASNGNSQGIFGKGSLFAFNKTSGEKLCETKVVGDQRSQITYVEQTQEILFTTKAGYLYAATYSQDAGFNVRSSVKLTGEQSTSQPKLYGDRIYVCSGNGVNKSGAVEVRSYYDLSLIYSIESEFYPQCGVALAERENYIDVYYNYNGYPGGIKYFSDSKSTLSAQASDYFVPEKAYRQYCIGHLFCGNGYLVYKNDSCTLFCLKADGSFFIGADTEILPDDMQGGKSFSYEDVQSVLNSDINLLDAKEILSMKYSIEIEYGEQSSLFIAINDLYADILLRDQQMSAFNESIKNLCADINKVNLQSRGQVLKLYGEYNTLPETLKGKVEGKDELLRAYNKVNTLFYALVIGVCVGAAIVVIVCLLVFNIKKRKKTALQKLMPESDE